MKEELEEEAEPPRAARDPGCPTEKQVEDHRLTHLPFRTWCKWCNLGRGRGLHHRQSPKSEIPVVGVDYFFITAGGITERNELEYDNGEEGNNSLAEARRKAGGDNPSAADAGLLRFGLAQALEAR